MSTKMQQQVPCNATKHSVTFSATLSNKDSQMKELGSWIKQHREKANLSQETAAEKAGLSRFQWIRIENGQSGTKRETLIQIAKVINADVNQTLRKGGFIDSSDKDKSFAEYQHLEFLSRVDFSIFNEEDLKEIADFIQYKEYKKISEEILNEIKNNQDSSINEMNISKTLNESDPNNTKFLVMKNLLMDKNLDYETAKNLSKLFFEAYDSSKAEYLEGKELATKSKKKIPIGKDTDTAEKAA